MGFSFCVGVCSGRGSLSGGRLAGLHLLHHRVRHRLDDLVDLLVTELDRGRRGSRANAPEATDIGSARPMANASIAHQHHQTHAQTTHLNCLVASSLRSCPAKRQAEVCPRNPSSSAARLTSGMNSTPVAEVFPFGIPGHVAECQRGGRERLVPAVHDALGHAQPGRMKRQFQHLPDFNCSAQYSGQIMQVAFEADTTSIIERGVAHSMTGMKNRPSSDSAPMAHAGGRSCAIRPGRRGPASGKRAISSSVTWLRPAS